MLKNLKMVTILAIVTIVFSFIGCKQNVYIPVPMGGGEVNLSPMTVRLTKTPELSNTTKTISVIVETVSEIEKVVWELYGSSNPQELLNNSSATSLPLNGTKNYEFDVTENGTYYVAVKDKLGRQEMATIYVNEFDRTPPQNVTCARGDSNGSQITVSFNYPLSKGNLDSPVDLVGIKYFPSDNPANESFTTLPENVKEFTINAISDEYFITFYPIDKLGNKNTTGTTIKVYKDDCKNIFAGDVILQDGSILKGNSSTQTFINNRVNAVAVIYSIVDDVKYAVGLRQSNDYLQWAPDNTTGYNTDFTDIQCNYTNNYSGGVYTHTFTGDKKGNDNWDYVKTIDPTGTLDSATNYPTFNFALNYATTAGLIGTSYESGWYVPSIAELYDVYTNKDSVNVSLEKLSVPTIGSSSNWYWSSSQSPYYCNNALLLGFSDGYVYGNTKDSNHYVLVVRAF